PVVVEIVEHAGDGYVNGEAVLGGRGRQLTGELEEVVAGIEEPVQRRAHRKLRCDEIAIVKPSDSDLGAYRDREGSFVDGYMLEQLDLAIVKLFPFYVDVRHSHDQAVEQEAFGRLDNGNSS